MRTERIYLLRRMILTVCKEYATAPVKMDDLLTHPLADRLHPTREELLDEWNGLLLNGYIEPFKDSNGEYIQITGSGLKQINNEVAKDVYIWGAAGLR